MIRVGTRASALARTQSGLVARALEDSSGERCELVEVSSAGDRSDAPLVDLVRGAAGPGVFVSALRDALLADEVDVAVHSLKDLPTADTPGIRLAAVPEREDPRDAIVARGGLALRDLPAGARVGTGSPRRVAMLRALADRMGLDLQVVDVRGNVDTRIARTGADLDAVVLALAGLRRLGRSDEVSEVLDPADVVPCPGQGALAVETRMGDERLAGLVADALEHPGTRAAVTAERSLLAVLDAGCSAPVGALARPDPADPSLLVLEAAMATTTGALVRIRRHGPAAAAAELGRTTGEALLLAAGTSTSSTTYANLHQPESQEESVR